MLVQRLTVHCPGPAFYFVEIYSTEQSMREAVLCLAGQCDEDVRALCLRYCTDSTYRGYKALGTIFLTAADQNDLPVVVHELTHAAIGYCNAVGLKPTKKKRAAKKSDEETLAEVMQSLLEQYLTRIRKP